MQKVAGEIFKSTCGRRLLAYYWFSILVPSSHHCMTVLWSTGAAGDTGRGLWSKQVMSQHLHHHPLQKGREAPSPHITKWKQCNGPSSPCFPNNWWHRQRSESRSTIHSTHSWAVGMFPALWAGAIAAQRGLQPVSPLSLKLTHPHVETIPSGLSRPEWWYPNTRDETAASAHTQGAGRGGCENRNGFSQTLNQGHYSSSLAVRKQQLLLHHMHFVFPLKAENKVGHYFIFQKPRLRILGNGTL